MIVLLILMLSGSWKNNRKIQRILFRNFRIFIYEGDGKLGRQVQKRG